MIVERQNLMEIREWSEVILHRAEMLDPSDRALLDQVLGRGVRPREVAAVTGVSTRTVQRRVRDLTHRLRHPQVVGVLRRHRRWGKPLSTVAVAVWVKGWSLRNTADRLGLTLHQVRQHVQTARGILEQAGVEGEE